MPAAILARDAETGITVQKMALEMDAGDILIQQRIALDGSETADSLLARAAIEGAPLIVRAIDQIEAGTARPVPQDSSSASYCSMLRKEDGEIRWNDSAEEIDARIRAFTSWPGAFTEAGGNVLLILAAHPYRGETAADPIPGKVIGIDKKEGILVQTGKGALAVERLQWRSKKPLDWKSFLNGTREFTGSTLGRDDIKDHKE